MGTRDSHMPDRQRAVQSCNMFDSENFKIFKETTECNPCFTQLSADMVTLMCTYTAFPHVSTAPRITNTYDT